MYMIFPASASQAWTNGTACTLPLRLSSLQGYLAHEKPPPRTLQ